MEIPFDVSAYLTALLRSVARDQLQLDDSFDPLVQTSDGRFGEFQSNGILPYGKSHGTNPRQLAQRLADGLTDSPPFQSGLVSAEVAGAGFLNFRLSNGFLARWLSTYDDWSRPGPSQLDYRNRRVVVDYSCPNTAKQMHVGHLRSLVIGDAIQRLLSFCGAKVIRDNHIGDWGTSFGLLLMEMERERLDLDGLDPDRALIALEDLYKRANLEAGRSPSALDRARQLLVQLQNGDRTLVARWERINRISYESFQRIYDLTGVQFDHVLGESFYRDRVDRVCAELEDIGLARRDQGALVVFHPEHPRFASQPFIIRKSDGASNYATTDLATILYRVEEWGADEIIYVTDARQRDHFEQLFLTVEKWFTIKNYALPTLRHVTFGTVCGEDGKAIKTRSGEPIRLGQLFEEAVRRARQIVQGKGGIPEGESLDRVAKAVGVGAIKYADLLQNRSSDYLFSWEKMLAFEGNTAPYLQYAVARIHALFRRLGRRPEEFIGRTVETLETSQERALARKLIFFPESIRLAINDFRPSYLCAYLYELAGIFSSFYNSERILNENELVVHRRLLLCARALSALECGLHLLGIDTLEKM